MISFFNIFSILELTVALHIFFLIKNIFWPYHKAHWILIAQPGIKQTLRPLQWEAWSPNHWTTREFPCLIFLYALSYLGTVINSSQTCCPLALFSKHIKSLTSLILFLGRAPPQPFPPARRPFQQIPLISGWIALFPNPEYSSWMNNSLIWMEYLLWKGP